MTGKASSQFQFQDNCQNRPGWRFAETDQFVDLDRGGAKRLFNNATDSIRFCVRGFYFVRWRRRAISGFTKAAYQDWAQHDKYIFDTFG